MQVVNALLHHWLNRFNYDLRRYVCRSGKPLSLLSLAVKSYLGEPRDFFFLQVGANDGIVDDPIHRLVQEHQLRGLLLEPIPAYFQELKANYADQPQLQFENCALWAEDGEQEFFRIRYEAYTNPLLKGMAGLSRDQLVKASRRFPKNSSNIESVRVPTLSAKSLFRKHGVAHLDLLLVDTEGFDDQIIYHVFDAGMNPPIVHYEHIHLSAARQDACCKFFAGRGYSFTRNVTDTLAMREETPVA